MDREKVIRGMEMCISPNECSPDDCPYYIRPNNESGLCWDRLMTDALALLKEQEGLLGIQQTANSITFVSTGTAQQGEARGLLLGKLAMHEWLKKELLYRGLLTNDIRAVFDEAKRQEGR